MAEETFWSNSRVTVTSERIIVGGRTYALRDITSVRLTAAPPKRGCAVSMMVVGILITIVALGRYALSVALDVPPKTPLDDSVLTDPRPYCVVLAGLAVPLAAAGYFLKRSTKPTYSVSIASSAGEVRALTSIDSKYISQIVARINEAIVRYR